MNTPAYDSPFRIAVVGVGQITQQAFLPALRSLDDVVLVAAVTGSDEKADALDDSVGVHDYSSYDRLLASGDIDAVYVATPVFRHREFAEPALEAGIHVLLEKPMATSVEDCEALIAAAERSGATLMVAYRMHQDAYMVELAERVARGDVGETRSFTSVFTHGINEDNHRGHSGFWGGPVPDFGAYPLNLVRHLFRAEPVRVHALGTRQDDRDFNFRDTVGVTLRFPDDRIAQYTLSYAAGDVDSFTLVGSRGSITSDSCSSPSTAAPRASPSAPLSHFSASTPPPRPGSPWTTSRSRRARCSPVTSRPSSPRCVRPSSSCRPPSASAWRMRRSTPPPPA